jgi:hypothetical protein
MSLIDRCEEVTRLIGTYVAGKEGYEKVSELRGELTDFVQRVTLLSEAVDSRALLIGAGMGTFDQPDVTKLRAKVTEVQRKLAADPRRQTLVQGRNWAFIGTEIDSLTREIETELGAAWEGVRKELRSKPSPDQVALRMARTEHNRTALEVYRTAHRDADEAIRTRPRDKAGLAGVRHALGQVDAAYARIDLNVPDDVATFLKRVSQADGASLADLTPAVRKWLEEHNEDMSYRVFPKRR